MSYTAKSNGDGTYDITNNGSVVATKVRAKRVSFSKVTSHTLQGAIHHLAGPCVVTVDIPGVGEVEATV
jgi:hypothetical protein